MLLGQCEVQTAEWPISPVQLVCGIELENKHKKTHLVPCFKISDSIIQLPSVVEADDAEGNY